MHVKTQRRSLEAYCSIQERRELAAQKVQGYIRLRELTQGVKAQIKTKSDQTYREITLAYLKKFISAPRHQADAHNEEYRKAVDYYMLRYKIRPGITGWAQVNGWRGETDTLEKMQMRIKYDLDYIRRWSLWMDAKIIVFTIFRAFTDKNAY